MFYLYVLRHTDGSTYVGYTSSLSRRLHQHNSGLNISTRRSTGKWSLVYYEAYCSKLDTTIRERRLKLRGATKYCLFNRIKNSMILCLPIIQNPSDGKLNFSYSEEKDKIEFGF